MMVTNSQVQLLIGPSCTFFKEYPFLKPHILFYSNGLAIWHNLPDTTHTEGKIDIRSAI